MPFEAIWQSSDSRVTRGMDLRNGLGVHIYKGMNLGNGLGTHIYKDIYQAFYDRGTLLRHLP